MTINNRRALIYHLLAIARTPVSWAEENYADVCRTCALHTETIDIFGRGRGESLSFGST